MDPEEDELPVELLDEAVDEVLDALEPDVEVVLLEPDDDEVLDESLLLRESVR